MFIILDGTLEVYKQHKHIAFRGVGEFFGEMSLLESKPRSTSVKAVTDSVLLEINKDVFNNFMGSNPKIIWDISKTLSQRIREDLVALESGYLELKRSEEKYRGSEEKYRGIVESASDLIIQVNPRGIINFVNASIGNLGYEVDELIGRPFAEIYDGKLGDIRKHQILTKRIGPRATTNMEVAFKVNSFSKLYNLVRNMTFLADSTGMWNVPQEMVMNKNAQKELMKKVGGS